MDSDRRGFLQKLGLTALCLFPVAARAGEPDAVAVVRALQDKMLDVVRQASEWSLRQRFDALRPTLGEVFDLNGMSKACYGPGWDDLPEVVRGEWSQALGDYVAATYAQRLQGFRAKGFVQDAQVAPRDELSVVSTKLIPFDGAPVPIDYVMRATAKGWRVADILANGSLSELTQWRRALRGQPVAELRRRTDFLLTP